MFGVIGICSVLVCLWQNWLTEIQGTSTPPSSSRYKPGLAPGFVSGYAPDRAVTFFCFAKRKSPKKRRADVRAASRCPGFWGQSPNSPSLRLALRVRHKVPQRNWCLTPITLRCSALPQRRGIQTSEYPRSARVGAVPRRYEEASSAEAGGSGAQMFEPAGRVSAHPARIEQRSVPAQPGDESGSPSLCLLSLGEARESESPVGARPDLHAN